MEPPFFGAVTVTQSGSWGISDAKERTKQELSVEMSQPLRVLPRLSWISGFAWVQRQGLVQRRGFGSWDLRSRNISGQFI